MGMLFQAFGALARSLFSVLAGQRSLGVLMYHRVLPEPDPMQPGQIDRASFARQMGLLSELFTPLRLDEAVSRLRRKSLPPRAVAVTFDDGYADNLHVAWPVLRQYSVPATVFVTAGHLDGPAMWNDLLLECVRGLPLGQHEFAFLQTRRRELRHDGERRALFRELQMALKYLPPEQRSAHVEALAGRTGISIPRGLMLTTAELKELHAAGVEIGAHTMTHPILARLSSAQAEREIAASKDRLGAELGADIKGFAYPNGIPGRDYTAEHVECARRLGFAYAASTAWGITRAASDQYQLPRMAYTASPRWRFLARLARSYTE